MINDDDRPRAKPALFTPPVLDALSMAELKSYRDDLKTEIERIEAEIAKKEAHKNAAEGIFKK